MPEDVKQSSEEVKQSQQQAQQGLKEDHPMRPTEVKDNEPKKIGQLWSGVTPQGAAAHDMPVMGDPLWRAPSGDAYHTTTQYIPTMGVPEQAKQNIAPSGGAPRRRMPARMVAEGGPTPEEQERIDRETKQAEGARVAQQRAAEQGHPVTETPQGGAPGTVSPGPSGVQTTPNFVQGTSTPISPKPSTAPPQQAHQPPPTANPSTQPPSPINPFTPKK